MPFLLAHPREGSRRLSRFSSPLWFACAVAAQEAPTGIAASKADLLALTAAWKGDRYPDGRPKVSADLLKRMKAVSIEEAWEVLRVRGFENQFAGGWQMLRPDQPFVGRALTASYLPSRPDLVERITQLGKAEGRIGPTNSWPIDMLQKDDVYIADGFGKVADGTLIGDNLGNAIYAKSGTGVVFDAGARDIDGLRTIEGFNAFVRGWDPSFMKNMVMCSINRPIRIGALTVLPGDVILARREGVIVIPAAVGRRSRGDVRSRPVEGRVRPLAPSGRRVHPRADRRALDRRDQGRLLQVAGRRARASRRSRAPRSRNASDRSLTCWQGSRGCARRRSRPRPAPSSRRRSTNRRSSRESPRCSACPRGASAPFATRSGRVPCNPSSPAGAGPRWRSGARRPRS